MMPRMVNTGLAVTSRNITSAEKEEVDATIISGFVVLAVALESSGV